MDDATLLRLLGAERGTVCMVGAGGKKTTMYRIARVHPGRVLFTTAVFIPPFDRSVVDEVILREPDGFAAPAPGARVVAFAGQIEKRDRHGALTPAEIDQLRARGRFDLSLVKCDGARNRLIKVPAEHEPVLPSDVDTVVVLASIRAVGRALDERIAHRPARVAAVIDRPLGSVLAPADIGRLLAQAYRRAVLGRARRIVPVLNMVDDALRLEQARSAARCALEGAPDFDHVLLACMRGPGIIEVVHRP